MRTAAIGKLHQDVLEARAIGDDLFDRLLGLTPAACRGRLLLRHHDNGWLRFGLDVRLTATGSLTASGLGATATIATAALGSIVASPCVVGGRRVG